MKLYKSEVGAINTLLVPLILFVVLFLGATGFGVWAYMERQDYKNNADVKIEAAVEVARKQVSGEKDNEFLEREKKPLVEYSGPSVFGNITFKYPKTWSGYEEQTERDFALYMDKGVVSGGENSIHALRVEVEDSPYENLLETYENDIITGTVKATAFRLEKLNDVLGMRMDGEIETGVNGTVILLPLRDKTIIIRADSTDFVPDLDNIILKNFTFKP